MLLLDPQVGLRKSPGGLGERMSCHPTEDAYSSHIFKFGVTIKPAGFFFQLKTSDPVVPSTLREQGCCKTSEKPPLLHTHPPGASRTTQRCRSSFLGLVS